MHNPPVELAWVKFALLTSLSIGLVNYLLGDLSARLGIRGSFPVAFGIIAMGILYHISLCCMRVDKLIQGQEYQKSVYFLANGDICWGAVRGVFIRGINHGVLICLTCLSFEFAAKAEINQGVIASLFTSGVVFTAILFYIIYGEKLGWQSAGGIVSIIAGVFLISISKRQDQIEISGDT